MLTKNPARAKQRMGQKAAWIVTYFQKVEINSNKGRDGAFYTVFSMN